MRHGGFFVAQQEARGDGRARTRKARHGGAGLRKADDEGVAVGDGLLLAGFGVIGESQQCGREQQHGAHDHEDIGGVEQGIDPVLEQEADEADGNHREHEFEHVGLLGVETAREETLQETPHFAPEYDDGAQDGGGVERHVEGEILFELDAQQLFGDLEVAAARNGQKFGDALHDAEQDGL